MGLAGSLPALLAGGTFAQAQQTSPPTLSNATAAEISVTAKSGQRPGTQAVFNAASLPPIESIGAESDIRPFLQPGVPQELTRAALRRAWVADPAIRDFIGLSENSWDSDARDDVPGVASPTTTDAGQFGTGGPEDRLLSAQKCDWPRQIREIIGAGQAALFPLAVLAQGGNRWRSR
jgi:hypothetical protein